MRFGAVDYVQKPFTEDELVEFANRLLIRRQDRRERMTAPEIRLVTPTRAGVASPHVVNVPGGVYVAPEHSWVRVEMTGEARVGLDDLFHKTVGEVAAIELPEPGKVVRRGERLFSLRVDGQELAFPAPVGGKVVQVNHELDYQLELMRLRPYENGWICTVDPERLTADLEKLTIGADAVERYQADARRFAERMGQELAAAPAEVHRAKPGDAEKRAACRAFAACFLQPAPRPAPSRPELAATAAV
jgi:glycine cleavage system H protein